MQININSELTAQFPLSETFEAAARILGLETAEQAAAQLLRIPMDMEVGVGTKNSRNVRWIPGSYMGSGMRGPVVEGTDVIVVGKMPGYDEVNQGLNMVGPNGRMLKDCLTEAGVDWRSNWYAANAVRFNYDGQGALPVSYIKECRWFLAQEIFALKPRLILLTGADAVKAVFARSTKLDHVRGCPYFMHGPQELGNVSTPLSEVDPKRYALRLRYGGCLVLPTILPAQIMHDGGLREGFVSDLELFKSLVENRYNDEIVKGDYKYLRSPREVKELFESVKVDKRSIVAVDSEWGYRGDPTTRRPIFRSVQISWYPGKAACLIFHDAGGVPAQTGPEMMEMLGLLKKFIEDNDLRLTGHNIRADAMFLEEYGIKVLERTAFDTMLADHIMNENAEHGLEYCTLRYTPMGRYDTKLNLWLKKNAMGRKKMKEQAYRDVPDDILYPYASCDADASLRICGVLRHRLRDPRNAGVRNCYEQVVMPASVAIYEIEKNGINVDRKRMEELVWKYDEKKVELLQRIRDRLGNEKFNPASSKQMRELLYGPKAACGLGLHPVKTTGKPSRMWDDLSELEQEEATPSTDQESLEYLAHEHPVVSEIRDYKLVEQVQKTFLRLPSTEDGQSGEIMFTDGLLGSIDPDGRIRTHLSQMSETGRHRSSNPNLQNLPKKQDKETSRIMGKVPTIRSCFTASPGNVLIEVDYKSAEVFTLGYLSNCDKLIRDAATDLHARGAVSRFGAPKWEGYDDNLPPPEEWLEVNKALRVCSKTLTFGIPYQRGAAAIAREITKSTKGKVYCDKDGAKKHIDNFYKDYVEVEGYVEMCKQSVIQPRYLDNPYGRRRRATPTSDVERIAAQQREFVNFPIQSTVADALNTALANFYVYRQQFPGRANYRLLLAVHDSVLLECPPSDVRVMVEEVIPICMSKACVIPSWRPQAGYKPTKPFTLDIDIEVTLRWQEKEFVEELLRAGLDQDLAERFSRKEKN